MRCLVQCYILLPRLEFQALEEERHYVLHYTDPKLVSAETKEQILHRVYPQQPGKFPVFSRHNQAVTGLTLVKVEKFLHCTCGHRCQVYRIVIDRLD